MTTRREYRQSGRLDNFVDAAFAFAITLLVISGANRLHSVDDLTVALRNVPAFAICFAQLGFFWHGHVCWREAFRLTDMKGLLLSLLLVFFALIFVFPLHLVFGGLANAFSGGYLSPDVVLVRPHAGALYGMKVLFVCYGLSYACMGGTLWLLFRHGAWLSEHRGHASALEMHVSAAGWAFTSLVGVISMLIALFAPSPVWVAVAGMSYTLLFFLGKVGSRTRRRVGLRLGVAQEKKESA